MKTRKILIVCLIFVLAVAMCALTACNNDDKKGDFSINDSISPVFESKKDSAASSSFSLESYLEGKGANDFPSESVTDSSADIYNNITEAEAKDYVAQYETQASGWTKLADGIFFKGRSLVFVDFSSSDGKLQVTNITVTEEYAKEIAAENDDSGISYSYDITQPTKTTYAPGEALDLSGFQIVKKGSDGSSVILVEGTDYTIDTSSFDTTLKEDQNFKNIHLPYEQKSGNGFSGTIVIEVNRPAAIDFEGADVTEFEQDYETGIVGKLTITLPTNTTDVSVMYRSGLSQQEKELADWTETAPQLTEPGNLYVDVRFSKEGYSEITLWDKRITINPLIFEGIDADLINNDSTDYTGSEIETFNLSIAIPEGATVLYKLDEQEWTETVPTVTEAGKYDLEIKITKKGYQTITDYAILTVDKAEVPGVSMPEDTLFYFAHEQDSLTLDINGILPDDVVTYSTDGETYTDTAPAITQDTQAYVMVARGKNYATKKLFNVCYVANDTLNIVDPQSSYNHNDAFEYWLYSGYGSDGSDDVSYYFVKTSSDNGETWSEWSANILMFTQLADINEAMPKVSADGTHLYKFRMASSKGYFEYTDSITLPVLADLGIAEQPEELKYIVGDAFSASDIVGLKITEYYENGTSAVVDYDPDKYTLIDMDRNALPEVFTERSPQKAIAVKCGNINSMDSTNYEIEPFFRMDIYDFSNAYGDNVRDDASYSTFSAKTLPTKLVYNVGETLDLSGLTVQMQVSQFGDRYINYNPTRYKYDSVDMNTAGEKTVTVYACVGINGTDLQANNVYFTFNITVE